MGLFLAVAALGILAKGALHGDGVLHDHVVHTLAVELDGNKGAANHIGAAGAGAGGGDAATQGVGESFVHGIDGVDGTELGGEGVNDLVIVHALPAHGLVVQADVTVGIHTAGSHKTAFGVNDLSVFGGGDVLSHRGDLAVVADENAAARDVGTGHGLYVAIFDQKHKIISFYSWFLVMIPHLADKCNPMVDKPQKVGILV